MTLQPGGSAVTIEERMYPCHPVMRTCGCNQGALPTACGSVHLVEAFKESRQRRGRWRYMASHLHIARSDLTGYDHFSIV